MYHRGNGVAALNGTGAATVAASRSGGRYGHRDGRGGSRGGRRRGGVPGLGGSKASDGHDGGSVEQHVALEVGDKRVTLLTND